MGNTKKHIPKSKEKRNFLQENSSIKLREYNSNNENITYEFEIKKVLSSGSSCVCYRAVRRFENGLTEYGTLKEFNPSDPLSEAYREPLDAGDYANQLYARSSNLCFFKKDRDEFYQSYKKLSKIIEADEKNDSFFAPIRIFRGISRPNDSDNATIYIWTAGDSRLKSFDEHLNELGNRLSSQLDNPSCDINLLLAYELHIILQAIKALALGIKSLHSNGLLHLDIKPSNFGIRDLGSNNGDNISVELFDINSFYSNGDALKFYGTKYFSAPELRGEATYNRYKISNKTDIYSLGATLYNSIIFNASGRGLFEQDMFRKINVNLSNSLLIRHSEYNSIAELRDVLGEILKRSLARNAGDYTENIENYYGVEGFIRDIAKADEIVNAQISQALKAGDGNKAILTIVNKEDYYSEKLDGGAVSSIQCMLYDNPLYDYVDENGRLSLLVLGAGAFGEKFINISFELCQIKNCYLDMTVVTNDEMDEKRYLSEHPEFANFFRVNGVPAKHSKYGEYGSINFVKTKDLRKDKDLQYLEKLLFGKVFNYAFISLLDDGLNLKIACELAKSNIISSDINGRAIINFITYKDVDAQREQQVIMALQGEKYSVLSDNFEKTALLAEKKNIFINPVQIRNTLINHKDYSYLCDMAFNSHLIWERGLNIDIKKAYDKFKRSYNNISSFAYALSVKYKLHSVGLNLEDVTTAPSREEREKALKNITKQFKDRLGIGIDENEKTSEQRENYDSLIYFEHRRWVTNIICSSSYTLLEEKDYINLKSTNKDVANRKHACILPSNARLSLSYEEWTELSNWDRADIENEPFFKELDPLDRMSVVIHRRFVEASKEVSYGSIESDARVIRKNLQGKAQALASFEAYMFALQKLYKMVKACEKGEARGLSREIAENILSSYAKRLEIFKNCITDGIVNKSIVEERIKSIDSALAPVKQAGSFTDYKALDQMLVCNIPFILNYNSSLRLFTAFTCETENNKWYENVAAAIIINPAVITYVAYIEKETAEENIEKLKTALLGVARVMDSHSLQTDISLLLYSDSLVYNSAELINEIKMISPRIIQVDIVEVKETELDGRIKALLEYNQNSQIGFNGLQLSDGKISNIIEKQEGIWLSKFRFNCADNSFDGVDNDYVFFEDIPFRSCASIEDMFALRLKAVASKQPELHRDYKAIWENCYFGEDSKDALEKSKGWRELCRKIKSQAQKGERLLDAPKADKSAKKESVCIFVPAFCRDGIQKLLSRCSDIGEVENLEITEHNSLMFKLSFTASTELKNAVFELFKNPYLLCDAEKISVFEENGRIVAELEGLLLSDFSVDSLSADAGKAFEFLVESGYLIPVCEKSYCFASSQIKELLTDENKLPELYTYYQLIENGSFDDVKFDVSLQNNNLISLVAIKDFKTQLTEFDSANEKYEKLKRNGNEFGINPSLVVINDNANGENAEQGIKIVSNLDEINQISEKLISIMNSKE